MPHYVEGFVIPIKKSKLRAYKKMALWGRKVWMKAGALSYYECVVDDFMTHGTSFKKLCKLKAGETVIFSYIVYKSKADRKRIYPIVMDEMGKLGSDYPMPFDMKRMTMAGCRVLVRS